MDSTIAGL